MEDVIFAGTQMRKPLGYAYVAITISNEDHKLDVPYVLFLGEDEITQGKVSLKDMRTGKQELLNREEAVEKVLQALKERREAAPIREK